MWRAGFYSHPTGASGTCSYFSSPGPFINHTNYTVLPLPKRTPLRDSRGPIAYSPRQPSPPPLIHFYGRLHTESLILRLSIFSFLEAATVLGCRESGLFCELPSNSDGGSPVSEKNPLLRLNE